MDYQLSVSLTGKYIFIKVNVPMTVKVGRDCGISAVALGKKHQINKYLFDLRHSPNIEGAHSNYEFANNDMQAFNFPKEAYSAFLVHADDHSHDFITAAFENAGYKVRLFTEEDLAIKWLGIKGP